MWIVYVIHNDANYIINGRLSIAIVRQKAVDIVYLTKLKIQHEGVQQTYIYSPLKHSL